MGAERFIDRDFFRWTIFGLFVICNTFGFFIAMAIGILLPAIADDTGLEVDALNGAPGVFTARYAGENCSYLDNVNKMLEEMKNVPKNKRGATFKTVMAYVDDNVELTSEGIVQGTVTRTKKGVAGFGYDPIFYVPDLEKTFAEMKIEEKNLVSHRSRAIKALKANLATYFNTPNIKENA